eukprot:4381416-Pyramimonas_sp.AAC.1
MGGVCGCLCLRAPLGAWSADPYFSRRHRARTRVAGLLDCSRCPPPPDCVAASVGPARPTSSGHDAV